MSAKSLESRSTRTASRRLELAFCHLWLHLGAGERQRVAEGFEQPFRRRWFLVEDGRVRELD